MIETKLIQPGDELFMDAIPGRTILVVAIQPSLPSLSKIWWLEITDHNGVSCLSSDAGVDVIAHPNGPWRVGTFIPWTRIAKE